MLSWLLWLTGLASLAGRKADLADFLGCSLAAPAAGCFCLPRLLLAAHQVPLAAECLRMLYCLKTNKQFLAKAIKSVILSQTKQTKQRFHNVHWSGVREAGAIENILFVYF